MSNGSPDTQNKASAKPLLYLLGGIAAITGLVGLGVEGYYFFNPDAAAQREYAAIERDLAQKRLGEAKDRQALAVSMCQTAIKAAAKVPRSVEFHSFGFDVAAGAGGRISVSQDFDAINALGMKTTNEGRCVFATDGQMVEFWWNGDRKM